MKPTDKGGQRLETIQLTKNVFHPLGCFYPLGNFLKFGFRDFNVRLSRFVIVAWLVVLLSSCNRPSDDLAQDNGVIYANTAKNVKYAGSEECAACHRDIYQAYAQSEMGRSMSRLDAANLTEIFPQTYEVLDSAKNFYYEMVRREGRFYQREYRREANGKITHERWMEAEYVMGSGNNLRMYFHDENGMLYELPLTWYAHKQRWDLSPGYREFENVRFSRYATAKCLACHNSYLEPSPTANDRYAPPYALGIGCERCHGPGELHVRQKSGEQLRDLPRNARTIVNPRKLSAARQLDVCRQCHLQGKAWALHGESDWFDYRPGAPLQNHRSVYFPAKTAKEVIEVADSPHRLALSRCFKESKAALTCITCHHPHFSIKTFSRAHYNEKCLQCHAAATLPGNNSRHAHIEADDCVRCHMNRTGTDNTLHGVSNTDHWIRVEANATKIDWTALKQPPARQPVIALVPDIDARDDSRMIRQGMAYWDYYRQHDPRRAYLDSAFSCLSRGLEKIPNSAAGFFYLGEAQIELQRHQEAIASFWRAASLRSGYAEAYAKLGWSYAAIKKFALATACYQQALASKPQEPRYLEGLGAALADSGNYAESVQAYERALQSDRQNPHTFYALGNIYVRQFRLAEKAAPYFEQVVQLDPDFPNGYLNLGSTYGVLGKYEEALRAFENELAVRPQSASAFFNQGRVYSLMGKKSAARRVLQQALAIDPTMAPARQLLARLQN